MRRFWSAVIAIVVFLSSAAFASASPLVVQQVCGSSTLSSSPINGSVVAGMGVYSASLVGSTLRDSHALTYPIRAPDGAGGVFTALYDGVVSGSPTATYAFSLGGAAGVCLYNLSNAISPGVYAHGSTASSVGTVISLTLSVVVGDVALCLVRDITSPVSGFSISNGTTVVDSTLSGFGGAGRATATATGSSTCSANVTVGDNVSFAFADYTSQGPPYTPWPWLGPILSQ